ncbi:M3 family metallopeptidase [Hydrogenophilus thermoluteolus]|uniref:M3 family metallopeptidase n=1 Tax=Hydrogenophilus thermoluteolus TaxID=297 RepID=UPI003F67BF7F
MTTMTEKTPTSDDLTPLLTHWQFPPFDALTPERATAAIRSALATAQVAVTQAKRAVQTTNAALTWAEWYAPLDEALERLGALWGVVAHLHSVLDTPEWRAVYNELLPEMTRFWSELGQDPDLYAGMKRLLAQAPDLNAWRRRALELEVRDRLLSGAELPETARPRFLAIQERLSALAAKFSENLLDATNAYSELVTDEAQLAGLPETVRAMARAAAERDGASGWKFTLQMPFYLPVMQYAEDRAWRARFYRAYATRASEFGPPEQDNGPILTEILALRQEEAQLLGFPHYAAYSLAPKMAPSPEAVRDFLADLARAARPYAERDKAELERFARDTLGVSPLEAWDIAFASEKLRQAKYAFSDDELRQYFPLPKVLDGLFALITRLYGVTFEEVVLPTWHADVRTYRLDKAGETVGYLYLDLFARETKKGGAWMNDAKSRHRHLDGRVDHPVVYLVCNFAPPVGDKPTTLTHDEVLTLFHEMGHGLHHLLTQVEEREIAGLNHVEWDAVELPSQFFEFFAWEWEVLQTLTAHVETGETLPRALFDKMTAARFFQAGMQTVRQIEFALFDFRIHSELGVAATPEGRHDVALDDVMRILDEVRAEVAVFTPPQWHRFPHSFSHIFAGGYAAGYYSYKWAEVLAADAYQAFLEAAETRGSVVDPTVGERFWREILAVGASRPALESFVAFRGREPKIDALLALTLGSQPDTEPTGA